MATKRRKPTQKTLDARSQTLPQGHRRDEEGFPVDRRGYYNGKPMSHWNSEADKLMMQCLIRASMVDTRSIVGAKVAERIINLAMAINPVLCREVISERDHCVHALPKLVADIMEWK